MRIRFALIIVLAIIFCTIKTRTTVADEASDQEELIRLEKVWNDAHLQGDADTLNSLWSEDLVVIIPKMGTLTKADSLAFLRSGRMKLQKYETSNVAIRLYGDAAVVTGRLVRARTINGTDMVDDWRFTKVYIRRNQKWQVVSWQTSESPQQ